MDGNVDKLFFCLRQAYLLFPFRFVIMYVYGDKYLVDLGQ